MSIDFYNQHIHTARKEHKCTLCRNPISKGEEYVYTVCKCYCEDLYTSKMHLTCDDLTHRYIQTLEPDDTYNEIDVLDDIRDQVCSICEDKASCKCKYWDVPRCSKVIETYCL